MRLNTQTDYALRLLMHLAVNDDKLTTIAHIASLFGVSKNHLMKVAHALGQSGLIETVRGRSGGLALARPAKTIRIGDVVRIMESDLALVECYRDANQCLITPACRLKAVFTDAMDAFLAVLDRHTLDDLVVRNPGLHNLLTENIAR